MPVVLLERIPLPSLRAYTGFSVILLACALFYAHQVVLSAQHEGLDVPVVETDPGGVEVHYMNISLPHDSYFWNMVYVMTAEAWCVWTLVNTAYCCLILLGKLVQKVVFGELRVSEQQHVKDKFWNFLFYKFIFVFGVMNVQTMEEVVLWVAWFTILGFYHLLTQLAKDRFEYVSFSPTTPRLVHVKLLSLLCVIILSCCGLFGLCVLAGIQMGITIFAFMAAECVLLAIRAMYVIARYCLHLIDMNLEGVWENRATYVYYTELIFELAALSVDFGHHLHMLLWGNIFLSMASLVICMQLRYLFYEFQRRVKRHKNYRRVVRNMEQRFSMATSEEISSNDDDCAVCWEKMETARKLPCGHLFHNSCLRSWLEQDTSCPTCRQSLSDRPAVDPNGNISDRVIDNEAGAQPPQLGNQTTNHFFHFDGSRYVSWLPSFSVEVTHTNMLANNRPVQTSQLDNMARQVLQVFPHMPRNAVIEDLRVTRSVDFTIENILEGRLLAPPVSTSTRSSDADLQRYFSLPREMGDAQALQLDRVSNDLPSTYSGRFSKSGNERESMLEDRKNTMLEEARRRFLSKSNDSKSVEVSEESSLHPDHPASMPDSSTSHTLTEQEASFQAESGFPGNTGNHGSNLDGLRHRRELAYNAATRRILGQTNGVHNSDSDL
ncbi:E3 ubiquitin-protein ligase AMFR-like isoform X2 [Dreissena polymorpha]|uniref:E3 ubiquitin-protein ligase AMFR-like isoform X2 n=1 Tax=Dreissena polymorpha TaxID=45954 RepID=UPI0022643A2B|nr:E3 ubiquitin-protein ligase AMFR-like isoform X2 [Dreissena polymorpha]